MSKPTYKHPSFIIETEDKRIEEENKRLWLSLKIDNESSESIIVILKNPSRATKDISDKTVYNVVNYIYRNRNRFDSISNIGKIIITNLIPYYETYSNLLANNQLDIIDTENIELIRDLTSKHKNVIIAWGDHPKGLYNEYESLKNSVLSILIGNNNLVYYVDKFSLNGNPKHGQIWSYQDELIPLNLNTLIK